MSSRENPAGWEWTVAPGIPRQTLEPLLAAFPELRGIPGAKVLKENRFRTVVRIDPDALPGASESAALRDGVIAKCYRYLKSWDRQRYRFLRSRAEQEWLALLRFEAAGIPTGAPLAVASLRAGGLVEGGGLLVRCLPGAVPLSEKLADGPRAARLLADAGAVVRRMHDAGIRHRDLHAENLLVCGPEEGIHIIDLHSCLLRRRVSVRHRRLGLARLVQSLGHLVPADELRLLVASYGVDALGGGGLPAAWESIRRRAEALERTRLRSRSKRCFIASTSFAVVRRPGSRLYHARTHSPEELETLSREGPAALLQVEAIERGWTGVAGTSSGPVRLKRRPYGFLERLGSLVASHPLRRAYAAGHALRVRGIPTPRVIALREKRRLGVVVESDLFTEHREDSLSIEEHLALEHGGRERAAGERARSKHRLAVLAGEVVRRLHDAGYFPPGLTPRALRVSWSPSSEGHVPRVEVSELDGARRRGSVPERARRRSLLQAASLPGGPVSATDLLRAFRAYAGPDGFRASREEARHLGRALLEERLRALEDLLRTERGG